MTDQAGGENCGEDWGGHDKGVGGDHTTPWFLSRGDHCSAKVASREVSRVTTKQRCSEPTCSDLCGGSRRTPAARWCSSPALRTTRWGSARPLHVITHSSQPVARQWRRPPHIFNLSAAIRSDVTFEIGEQLLPLAVVDRERDVALFPASELESRVYVQRQSSERGDGEQHQEKNSKANGDYF